MKDSHNINFIDINNYMTKYGLKIDKNEIDISNDICLDLIIINLLGEKKRGNIV